MRSTLSSLVASSLALLLYVIALSACGGTVAPALCRAETQACATAADCCNPLLCSGGTCQKSPVASADMSPPACTAQGVACAASAECCNPLVCTNGVCAAGCRSEGGACAGLTDCCEPLVCTAGKCAQPAGCRGRTQACVSNNDCCMGTQCITGKCAVPPPCAMAAGTCATSADCCNPLVCVATKCAMGQATMTIITSDQCNDGQDVQYRFFDDTTKQQWPADPTQVYVMKFGATVNNMLTCNTGDRICLGAGQAMGVNSWGVGIDGKAGCPNCCITCMPTPPPITIPPLTCK